MNAPMSRKDRRAMTARANKKYGIKGDAAMRVSDGYSELSAGRLSNAVQIASEIAAIYPESCHPWIILGQAALKNNDGSTALSALTQAASITPRDPVVLNGLGLAHYILKQPLESFARFIEAIRNGSKDPHSARVLRWLAQQMGRELDVLPELSKVAAAAQDDAMLFDIGVAFMESGKTQDALSCFRKAAILKPGTLTAQEAKIYICFAERDFAGVLNLYEAIPREKLSDHVACLLMGVLRRVGRSEDARELLQTHDFMEPAQYQNALSHSANILHDEGRMQECEDVYREALYIDDAGKSRVAAALGALLISLGKFEEGCAFYTSRTVRRRHPNADSSHAKPENLKDRARITLVEEQGVGDQLALLPPAVQALQAHGVKHIRFLCSVRMAEVLEGCKLPIEVISWDQWPSLAGSTEISETVLPADLLWHMQDAPPPFDGYLEADKGLVDSIRERYTKAAGGRPIIGLSWSSSNPYSGSGRSIPARDLLECLPENAFVVNLQYGASDAELRVAARDFPGMTIHLDKSIDQMEDMKGFAAQLAALDEICTIDNTTAHTCGAFGLKNAHVLLPLGPERMWYWGAGLDAPSWYSAPALYDQATSGDWSAPLARLKRSLNPE